MRDALERIGGFERPAGRADRGRRSSLALPQQARVLVRRRTRAASSVLGFHRPGRWDLIDDVTERHPRLRAHQRGARGGEGLVPRARASPRGTARAERLPPQPGRARGAAHRPAPGAARHEPGRVPRDQLAAATPADSLAVDARRGRGGDHPRRRDEGGQGRGEARGGAARGLRFRISPDAFFQTNTEMAEVLYGDRGRAGRASPAASGCSTCSAASARSRSRSRSTPGEVWGVELIEEAVADAIENARLNGVDNAQLLRRRRAHGDAPAARASPAARRGGGRPAARRALAEGRAAHPRGGGEADRLRVVQPDDAGAERAPDRRRAATSSRPCGRSTCSRRRRTSSAWRCWSAA